MKHIKEFQEFINESIDNVNEAKLKADKEVEKLNSKLTPAQKDKGLYWKISTYENVNEIKKGSIIIPYAMDRYGEFIVDKVFKNKDGETSYTGKFKKNGERREFILHSKDRIVKESVNKKFGSKYDIGAGSMGSGTTFWNRAQEVDGDYKTIAHVSDNGKVTFYDKKLPNDVKKHIEDYAKTKNESVNEAKLKADKKAHKELSQAIVKADNVEDIWNQLDPKMFDVNLNDFEDIFNKWFNSQSSYDNVPDFAKNATTSDTQDLLNHLAKNIK